MHRIGIALGGGGITGTAHLGVLKALEEAGVDIHCFAGTSSGGLISALYACGYSIAEIIDMVPEVTRKYLDYDYRSFIGKVIWRNSSHRSLIKGRKFRELLRAKLGDRRIADVPMPLVLVATDLRKGSKVVFASRSIEIPDDAELILDADLVDAVQASCSIPSVFPPVEIEDRLLVDGGLIDNCPCDYSRALGADAVIAVDFSVNSIARSPLDSLLAVVIRSVNIMLLQQARQLGGKADVLLNPDVSEIAPLEFDKTRRCIELGYECTRLRMDEIRSLLERVMPLKQADLFSYSAIGELASESGGNEAWVQ